MIENDSAQNDIATSSYTLVGVRSMVFWYDTLQEKTIEPFFGKMFCY